MDYICTRCSYTGQRKKINAGSGLVSVMFWVILPSIYMLWGFNAAGPVMEDPIAALEKIQNYSTSTTSIILTLLGPTYSIWRRINKTYACPKCNEKIMVAMGAAKKNNMLPEDDLSLSSIKEIPFIWEKDVQEYNERHKDTSKSEDIKKLVLKYNDVDLASRSTNEW